jgi:hypothetical protein
MTLRSTQPLVKMNTRNISGGKGGPCVRLTTSSPSRAECHEILGSKPPGTLWATPSPLRGPFTFKFYLKHCIIMIYIYIWMMQMRLHNTFWNQNFFFHNSACNLAGSNSLCRTFFPVAVRVLLWAVYVKTVKELKRPSSNERRDEPVGSTDASFKSEFMFVVF